MEYFLTHDQKNIVILDNKHQIADYAIDLWQKIANKAVKEKGFFTVALSGGKTPITFYQALSNHIDDLPWDKTYIFLVDERFVPHDHKYSNFKMIQEKLLQFLPLKQNQIFSIPTEHIDLSQAAQRYEKTIHAFFQSKDISPPCFDLIMLGVGLNGHTASLFPQHEALNEKHHLTAAVTGKNIPHDRITLTYTAINSAKHIMFILSGKKKTPIAKRVIIEKDQMLPASHIKPNRTNKVYFLLDKNAALDISRA